MRGSFCLGRIAGIEIGVNYTWIIAFIIISWFQVTFFQQVSRGYALPIYWLMGMLSVILLFVAVLLHELAHSLYARSRGIPVSSIVFFIFGGVSNISQEAQRPRDEFLIALFGPLTSLVLSLIFLGILFPLVTPLNPLSEIINIYTGNASVNVVPLVAIIYYLALINFLLAIFNMLPAYPLDGGRVFRAIVWGITKNVVRSTSIAATVGQAFGWAMVAYGVYTLVFISGGLIGGIWIAFIGWFLMNAASASKQETTLREHLKGIRVRDVMQANPETVTPGMPVADLVRDYFIQRGRPAVAVTEDGRLEGIVTLTNIKAVPQDKWPLTRVADIMTRTPLYSVGKDDELQSAFNLIAEHDLNQVLVLEAGKLVGLLTRADILRYLHLSHELRFPAAPPAK